MPVIWEGQAGDDDWYRKMCTTMSWGVAIGLPLAACGWLWGMLQFDTSLRRRKKKTSTRGGTLSFVSLELALSPPSSRKPWFLGPPSGEIVGGPD